MRPLAPVVWRSVVSRTKELDAGEVTDPAGGEESKAELDTATPAKAMPRWMVPSMVLHAALFAAVLFTVHTFGKRIEEMQANISSTREHVSELSKTMAVETATLKSQSGALKQEVENLRQYIAS